MTPNELAVDGLAAGALTFSGHKANGKTGSRNLAAAVAFEFCTVLGKTFPSWISAHSLELCLAGSASGRARFNPKFEFRFVQRGKLKVTGYCRLLIDVSAGRLVSRVL